MVSIPSTQAHLQEQHAQSTVSLPGTTKKHRTKQNFTIISNEILRDPTLTKGAKLALITLLSYCWFEKNHCFPGQERLSKDLDKSIRTIRRYLTELQEKKHIKIVHRGLGKTNLYYISWPPQGTEPAALEGTEVSCPERTKMTAESDEPKHTQVEADEAFSNCSKVMLEVIQTDSHRATVTTGNEGQSGEAGANHRTDQQATAAQPPISSDTAEHRSIEPPPVKETGRERQRLKRNAEVMGKGRSTQRAIEPPRMTAPPFTQEDMDTRIRERLARERVRQQSPLDGIIPPEHQQTLNRQFGAGAQQTACRSKRQPVSEKLQVAIERISEELGDCKHVTANITQAENIRREARADSEQFIRTLYDARATTRHAVTTGKIQKQDSNGQLIKMPYFYAVLRQKAGLPKAQRTI